MSSPSVNTASICLLCWKLIAAAVKVLDATLRGSRPAVEPLASLLTFVLQRTLASSTYCGSTVVVVVSIAGCVDVFLPQMCHAHLHLQVCDKRARVLSDNARSKVAKYLHLYEGNANTDNKITLSSPIHPSFEYDEWRVPKPLRCSMLPSECAVVRSRSFCQCSRTYSSGSRRF